MGNDAENSQSHAADALSGARKAAILLASLCTDEAKAVLNRLPAHIARDVERAMDDMNDVAPHVQSAVFEAFHDFARSEGRPAESSTWIGRSRAPRTPQVAGDGTWGTSTNDVSPGVQSQLSPFSFLQSADRTSLMTFIQDEHPQTIALILAHLPQAQASELLVGLSGQKQIDVVRRIANMEPASAEIVHEVERGLLNRLSEVLAIDLDGSMGGGGGVESAAELLSRADPLTEREILEGLEEDDPELVENLRRLMFAFDDIALLDDDGIRAVLDEVDCRTLALALTTASNPVRTRIWTNMSRQMAADVEAETQSLRPACLSDIEQAQQSIADVVRRLSENDGLVAEDDGGGGEREVVV